MFSECCKTFAKFLWHLYSTLHLVAVLEDAERLLLAHGGVGADPLELLPAEEAVPVRVPGGEGHQHAVPRLPLALQPRVRAAAQPAQALVLAAETRLVLPCHWLFEDSWSWYLRFPPRPSPRPCAPAWAWPASSSPGPWGRRSRGAWGPGWAWWSPPWPRCPPHWSPAPPPPRPGWPGPYSYSLHCSYDYFQFQSKERVFNLISSLGNSTKDVEMFQK